MVNTSGRDRESLILSFAQWDKKSGGLADRAHEVLGPARLAAMSPALRQALGVERADGARPNALSGVLFPAAGLHSETCPGFAS